MDSIAYSCCRKNPTLRKIRPSKLGLLTNKRRNKNYGSLPLGGSTPVSSSPKGPRSVTPSEVSAREDFGRRSPGLLLSATGGDGRGDGGTRDCEEGKNSKLETGNFGGKSEKKEAHAMRETEEETRRRRGGENSFGAVI